MVILGSEQSEEAIGFLTEWFILFVVMYTTSV